MLAVKSPTKERIRRALRDDFTRAIVESDFIKTFKVIGAEEGRAGEFTRYILNELALNSNHEAVEQDIYRLLSSCTASEQGGITFTASLDIMFKKRAREIFNQVFPHFQNTTGTVLDFGCGDGRVTQLLKDEAKLDIVGTDVRSYRAPGINVKIKICTPDTPLPYNRGQFTAALATNVLHHDAENERCLTELSRVTRHKLVVIETVPTGDTPEAVEKDRERTFMNDYLYNRLLHDPAFNVPVPGTYETPQGWIDRFARYGWRCTHSEDLGIDQPAIQDTHHLLVFER